MLLSWKTLSDVSTESLLIVFLVVGKVAQMLIVCTSAPCFATCEVVLAAALTSSRSLVTKVMRLNACVMWKSSRKISWHSGYSMSSSNHKERSRTKQTRGMLRLKNNLLRPWKSQAPGEPGPMAFRTEHWLTNSQINSSHPGSHLWGAPECNPIDPN